MSAKAAVLEHFAQHPERGALVVASTGCGKTSAAHFFLQEMLQNRERVLWIAAQDELVFQPEATCARWWPQFTRGIVKSSRNEPRADIVYASRQTLARSPKRLDNILKYGVPAVVVVDECHESLSDSWRTILDSLLPLGCRLLGLTATPERADGRSLSDYFDLVFNYPLLDALQDKCIVQPYVSDDKLPGLDLDRVAVSHGDYLTADLEKELMRNHVVEHTVATLARTHESVSLPFRDQRATFDPRDGGVLVHTVTVDQAKATAVALNQAGWTARVVWGEMPKGDRARLLEAFRKGSIQVLCSPAALAQGTDLPSARVNVLCRPTRSHRLFVQIMGRVLRPHEDKFGGLLIDMVGASRIHSLVGAPVLVDGFGCQAVDDGKHRYLETSDGGGVCQNCGVKIRCYRNKGAHKFKHGKCLLCDAPQCGESPDKHHHWVAWGQGKKRCAHCTLEIVDKLFTLAKVNASKEPVAWVQLSEFDARVWAVDLGRVGTLFNVRFGQFWKPLWVTRRGATPLAPGLVSPELSRLLTDDVARQATQVRGRYGAQPNEASSRLSRIRVLETARRLRVLEM